MLRYATQNGFRLRFDSEFLGFTENEKTGSIESVVQDLVTGANILVRSKYLCGADGANSSIVRQLQLPLRGEPFQGLALNVFVEADMVKYASIPRMNYHGLYKDLTDASHDPLYGASSHSNETR